MNKFTGIIYPFFGIKHKPWNVYFDKTKIQLQKTFTGHYETVDDKSLKGDYFARLAQMDKRLKFDYTCKNLQEVEVVRLEYLGKKGFIPSEMKLLGELSIDERKFKGQELENHKLLREISDPEDEGGLVETKAGQASGILINGVEILNYKSVDSIFYGRVESVDVDGGGFGYDVISPPDFNIADPTGIGATGNVAVRGTFNEIRVVDTGFDYIGKPTIKISGGNGKDATADVPISGIPL